MSWNNLTPVAIFAVPRSGTSWLGQIFNSSPNVAFRFQPLFSYAFKNRLNEKSTQAEIKSFYEELLKTNDNFVLQRTNVTGREEYDFSKTEISHLVWKEVRYLHIIRNLLNASNTKVIGLVRHPCGVINSWINAPKEFDKSWNILEEWKDAPKKNLQKVEEFNGYAKWKTVAFNFIALEKEFPERFRLLKYEDLNNNTVPVMESLFDFCDLPIKSQTLDFIRETKTLESTDAYGVFRRNQKADLWQDQLSPIIKNEILNDADFHVLNEFYKWT
jgi:hypothetical protein